MSSTAALDYGSEMHPKLSCHDCAVSSTGVIQKWISKEMAHSLRARTRWYFTGTVRGGSVTFEPGARSAWHTHPLGQILIVTSGFGWVTERGPTKS